MNKPQPSSPKAIVAVIAGRRTSFSITPKGARTCHNGDQVKRPRMLRMMKIGSSTPDTPRSIDGSGPNASRRANQRAHAQIAIALQL